MQVRYASNPQDFKHFDTERLRNEFLCQNLMQPNELNLVYSHYDRFIIGCAMPLEKNISLPTYPELRAEYFLERREIGIINTGGAGIVAADGKEYKIENKCALYIGKGTKEVVFKSADAKKPAKYFVASAPAHKEYPVQMFSLAEAEPFHTGAAETANKRTVYKLIHEKGIQSCQLVMGLTMFEPGSIWNTMPPHVHDRRMEAYFYFDLPETAKVMHFMGQAQESRHLVVGNDEAIISPPWSMHFGVGTASYSFIWCMCGENKDYTDMDLVLLKDLK